MKVRFLAPAEIEMLEASAYYEMQVQNLGANYLDIIEEAIVEISENPKTWPVVDHRFAQYLIPEVGCQLITQRANPFCDDLVQTLILQVVRSIWLPQH